MNQDKYIFKSRSKIRLVQSGLRYLKLQSITSKENLLGKNWFFIGVKEKCSYIKNILLSYIDHAIKDYGRENW